MREPISWQCYGRGGKHPLKSYDTGHTRTDLIMILHRQSRDAPMYLHSIYTVSFTSFKTIYAGVKLQKGPIYITALFYTNLQ